MSRHMHAIWRKTRLTVGFSLLALALIGAVGTVRGALIHANFKAATHARRILNQPGGIG